MSRVVRTWALYLALVSAILALGCERGEESDRIALSLTLSDAAPCRPVDPVPSLRFEAVGHFAPTTPGAVSLIAPTDTEITVDTFPPSTRAFSVEAISPTWQATGVAFRPERGGSISILLMPSRRACLAADPELRTPISSAVVGLPDASLLIAGGREGSQASHRVIVRFPGERFARVVPDRLSARREGATATAIGSRVFIVGGGGLSGPAFDSYEVYDHAAFELDRNVGGFLANERRDHGATALPDGRLLLVGGKRDAEGPPIDSAEILDPEEGFAREVGALPFARRAPLALTLDDGTTLVLGGFGEGSSPHHAPGVFAFDRVTETFATIDGVTVSPHSRLTAVALPGARAALVGDSRPGLSSAIIHVLRNISTAGGLHLVSNSIDLRAQLPELSSVAASAALDGKLILTGVDEEGARRAFLVDLGLARVEPLPTIGAPAHLISLTDGLVVALDADGAVLLRLDALTPYAHPPAILVDEEIAFDLPANWAADHPTRFTALVDYARFDLPPYRFDDFAVEAFEVESETAELLLMSRSATVSVRVAPDLVGLPFCEVERLEDAPLILERRGPRLTLSAGGASRICVAEGLSGEVRIAVRARSGATVHAPHLVRR